MFGWFRVFFDTMKVLILFVACTALFYFGLMWVGREYESYSNHDWPEDRSVKVFEANDAEAGGWVQQLKWFYEIGP
ncbi:MAG TPA: DUF4227 family protein [Bacillales bacterium]|nr:DUF4227 family protein [Bacillales bacterium]